MNKRNKCVFVAVTVLISSGSISISAEENINERCTSSSHCETSDVVWTNVGEGKVTSTGSKAPNNTYVTKYEQEQISNEGVTRIIITDEVSESYDRNGNLLKVEDLSFTDDGKNVGNKVEDYIYNPLTKQVMISNTRIYEMDTLVSEKKIATTWKSDGIKKFTTGTNGKRNSTYIEDFKELETSNFGVEKWTRKDYVIYKYNSEGYLIKKEDRDYNLKGDISGHVVYDYKYNQLTKENTAVRTRTYVGSKLTSDVKVANLLLM